MASRSISIGIVNSITQKRKKRHCGFAADVLSCNSLSLFRYSIGGRKIIRNMTLDDYDKIIALWKNTDGLGLRSLDDSKQGISLFLNRNPATNFVAVDNDEIIGTILCGQDGRRGYIYHTVVEVAIEIRESQQI